MENNLFENINFKFGLVNYEIVKEKWNFKWDKEIHQYDYNRLYIILNGRGVITLLNGDKIEILPGYIYNIPKNSIYETLCLEQMEQYYIHYVSDSPLFTVSFQNFKNYAVKADENSLTFFRNVIFSKDTNNYGDYLKKYSSFLYLLSMFLKDFILDTNVLLQFSETINYIETNFMQPITVKQLAEMKGYNTVYFSNKFKSAFSISPQQFIINRRIEQAQKLLLTTDLSINEIALKSGFFNNNYFNECFKKFYNMSPSKFRKKVLDRL